MFLEWTRNASKMTSKIPYWKNIFFSISEFLLRLRNYRDGLYLLLDELLKFTSQNLKLKMVTFSNLFFI